MAKKPIVSSVPVSFSIFRVQRFLLAFVNNIDDQGPRVLLNSIFVNQFKCITWKKLRVFVLKFAISGHHLTFLWTYCNAIARASFIIIWCSARGSMLRWIDIFWYSPMLGRKSSENLKSTGGPRNINPGRAITWLVGITIYCTIF